MRHLLTIIMILSLQACVGEKSGLKFSAPDPGGNIDNLTEEQQFAFEELQQKVLKPSNCLNCHSGLATFEGVQAMFKPGNPEESSMFVKMEDGSMPMGGEPVTTEQLEITRSFINSFSVPVEPEVVDFAVIQQRILVPHCIQCHSKVTSEEALGKWINKKKPLKSLFLSVVASGKMPKNKPRLDVKEQMLIKKYLEQI